MSHFSTMPALFASLPLIKRALQAMGVSPEHIWESPGQGRFMETPFSDKGKRCQLGVSLAGMKQLSQNEITVNSTVANRGDHKEISYIRPSGDGESAEIGFYWDEEANGYRVQTDAWVVGREFTRVFSAAYQVEAAHDSGLVVTGVSFTETGDIQLSLHKPQAAAQQVEAMAVRL